MDPVSASREALDRYAREPGRSAWVSVRAGARQWSGGVAEEEVRPAASLLKLPLAVAAEAAMSTGRLDPGTPVAVADLLRPGEQASVLDVLRADLALTPVDLIGLALSTSDAPSARWLLDRVGLAAVRRAVATAGCRRTLVRSDDGPGGPLAGTTTARDALLLLDAAVDGTSCPRSAYALSRSVRASRIPLGVDDGDIEIAHKTGTLAGVAHDVAVITCRDGQARLAFLTERQHDTLVTGYDMGECTRAVLRAWGLSASATVGVPGA